MPLVVLQFSAKRTGSCRSSAQSCTSQVPRLSAYQDKRHDNNTSLVRDTISGLDDKFFPPSIPEIAPVVSGLVVKVSMTPILNSQFRSARTVNSVYGDSMSGSWEIRAQIYGELQ